MSVKEIVILVVIAAVGYYAGSKGLLSSFIPSGS